jgi:hypothetical protein
VAQLADRVIALPVVLVTDVVVVPGIVAERLRGGVRFYEKKLSDVGM